MEDPQQIILEALSSYPGQKRPMADSIMVCCPFHDDSSPSCGVYIAVGMSLPLGSFNCFGCGAKGGWNYFAKQADLPTIKEWSAGIHAHVDGRLLEDDLLRTEFFTMRDLMRTLGTRVQYTEWPKEVPWRGYSGKMVHKVGGYMINDSYSDSIMVLFSISINGKIRGGVKAYMEKRQNGLNYVTTKGQWVRDFGLFPFDYVKRKMDTEYIVLVEGPRDALRLITHGIPALAILGAKNFTERKGLLVSSLLPERVYTFPDNDDAGSEMHYRIKDIMSDTFDVHKIKLPKSDKKLDPGNVPLPYIKKLKHMLTRR
jgi:5S rRNA maturation endonuclease (ribonuclease M5)